MQTVKVIAPVDEVLRWALKEAGGGEDFDVCLMRGVKRLHPDDYGAVFIDVFHLLLETARERRCTTGEAARVLVTPADGSPVVKGPAGARDGVTVAGPVRIRTRTASFGKDAVLGEVHQTITTVTIDPVPEERWEETIASLPKDLPLDVRAKASLMIRTGRREMSWASGASGEGALGAGRIGPGPPAAAGAAPAQEKVKNGPAEGETTEKSAPAPERSTDGKKGGAAVAGRSEEPRLGRGFYLCPDCHYESEVDFDACPKCTRRMKRSWFSKLRR